MALETTLVTPKIDHRTFPKLFAVEQQCASKRSAFSSRPAVSATQKTASRQK
jgi:hypothetical protein